MRKLSVSDSQKVRQALTTLALLCKAAKLDSTDVNVKFWDIGKLFAQRLAARKTAELETGNYALNSYNLEEHPGFSELVLKNNKLLAINRLLEEGASTPYTFPYSSKETDEPSIYSEIRGIAEFLKGYLPKRDAKGRDKLDEFVATVSAYATSEAKDTLCTCFSTGKCIDDTRKDVVGISAEPEVNPDGTVTLTEDLNNQRTRALDDNSFEGIDDFVDNYLQITSIMDYAQKHTLPVYYGQDIKKKHLKKGIYLVCKIYVDKIKKTSKKAIFIDCNFINKKLGNYCGGIDPRSLKD